MKEAVKINKSLLPVSCLLLVLIIAGSCERKADTIRSTEILTLPSVTRKDFRTVYFDSGRIQLIMTSPLLEAYENNESPYYEFNYGISVIYLDGTDDTVASVISKYAVYLEKKRLWELKDSVIVIGNSGDKLETELLFWDQEKDFIYTDRFVKLTNEYQTVMGTGFESDSKLTRRWIKNVTATIFIEDE